MILPDLSNSMWVARMRYIQSIKEDEPRRNPDSLVRYFIPRLDRWRARWLGRRQLNDLRAIPFYYYLVARTRYYDQVVREAVDDGVKSILLVGCGSDTRAYRFRSLLVEQRVRMLECDQVESINAKRQAARRLGDTSHIDYMAIDLNDGVWPDLERWLETIREQKALVVMEGVSLYVHEHTFVDFLRLLGARLKPGGQVAYDFKIRGANDAFGRVDQIQKPFRLSMDRDELAGFHRALGLRLEQLELGSDLTERLVPGVGAAGASPFDEDGLLRLRVARE